MVVGNGQGGFMMDLHGLHASEALRLLQRELSKLKSGRTGGAQRTLQICVGTGSHTKACGLCFHHEAGLACASRCLCACSVGRLCLLLKPASQGHKQ